MRRALGVMVSLVLFGCESQSGYDPARYATKAAVDPDPETEPLPPGARRFMIDPRSPVDAGTDAP